MITFKEVSKKYANGFDALNQVNFSLARGEMAFLTGHSGAGKSTVLKLASLLERPTSGDICVNGVSLSKLSKREVPSFRAQLGVVFQSPHLLADESVFSNVALPLHIQGHRGGLVKKRVHASLDKVGLLKKQHCNPCELSGGEQQRVGLARAMVHKPLLLLADEPTGNLDPTASLDIMNVLQQLNESGVGVLVATHDLTLIAGMKHRILMLKGGHLC